MDAFAQGFIRDFSEQATETLAKSGNSKVVVIGNSRQCTVSEGLMMNLDTSLIYQLNPDKAA